MYNIFILYYIILLFIRSGQKNLKMLKKGNYFQSYIVTKLVKQDCLCNNWIYLFIRRVWRYQRGNQNPYIVEEQTTQWPKEKVQKDKQRSTKHTYKAKDRVTRTPLKTGGSSFLRQIGCFLRVFRFYPATKLTATIYNWNIVERYIRS